MLTYANYKTAAEFDTGYTSLLRHEQVTVHGHATAGEDHFSVLSRLGDPTSNDHRLALGFIRS